MMSMPAPEKGGIFCTYHQRTMESIACSKRVERSTIAKPGQPGHCEIVSFVGREKVGGATLAFPEG